MRNAYEILVKGIKGERTLRSLVRMWKYNARGDLKIACENLD
jgi:hypothetical protein